MSTGSRVLGAAAAALLLTLTACGTPAPPAEDGREIVIAFPSDVDTIDPHQFRSIAAYGVVGNIYATLLQERYADPVEGVLEYTGESEPYLAESATWNADRTALTFVLRPGAVFADGAPVLAEDVVYSLQRALSDVGYSAAIGAWLNVADPVNSIVAVDERTVELRVTHYSPLIERFLTFQIFPVLDKSALGAAADDPWAAKTLATKALASRPYVIESEVAGQSVTLARNTKFTASDLTGAPDRVVVQNMPDPQQSFLALQNGAVDLVFGLTPDIAGAVAADPKLRLYELAYSDIVYLGMNNADPALSDVRVRRAISLLMPYDALRKDVMKGYASAAYGAVPHPMTDALDPTGEKVAYPTDVAAAKALLAEAGIGEGQLALTLSVPASEPTLRQSAVFLQSSMAQAGIRVTVDELSDADFNSNLGKLQMYVDSWFSWGQDSVYQLYFLLTSGKFTNYTNFSDPRVDDLVARAMATSDLAERTRLSQEAQRIVIEQAPWAFLYARDMLIGAQSDITGVTHSNDANLRFDRLRKGR